MLRRTTARGALVALAAAALAAPLAVPAGAAGPVVSPPLATGLSGPLGLAVSEDGLIYVAQSFGDPEEGTPSRLTEINRRGDQRDIATVADGEIAGVDAHAPGTGIARLTYVTTGGSEQTGPYAWLRSVRSSGRLSKVADLQRWEETKNPDAGVHYGFSGLDEDCAEDVPEFIGGGEGYDGIVEAHPYATVSLPDGSRVVADAAGNTLIKVSRHNVPSTLAVMPRQPLLVTREALDAVNAGIEEGNAEAPPEEQLPLLPDCVVGSTYDFEAVPTDVELGPDGWLYVSTLPGGPEDPSLGARGAVYKVHPRTGRTIEVARGFLGATNLAVSPDKDIYVAELFAGRISKVVGRAPQTVVELPFPAAVEFAQGKLYATIDAFGFATPDGGSLVTITP